MRDLVLTDKGLLGRGWTPSLTEAQFLDLAFLLAAAAVFTFYHIWYYTWHRSRSDDAPTPEGGYARLDVAGQKARLIWVHAILSSESETILGVQTMRNTITAASILATGASVAATTVINTMLDDAKMEKVRSMGAWDPLTGGSGIIPPEAKMGAAVGALFLCFFSLVQSLRLFVHFGFFSKAVTHARAHPDLYPPEQYGYLYRETVQINQRAQSFFSVGLRALYLFIPLVTWSVGGTMLLLSMLLVVGVLYVLDRI